jgi:ribonuclease BN (tRNA processing enzyme)
MKCHFLGTNGWYDTPAGNTICILIESGETSVVLDAGSGLWKLDRVAPMDRPVYLFLSHFHLDHLFGLHTLNKFSLSHVLRIYGQPGTREILTTLINPPFTVGLHDLPYPVHIVEWEEGDYTEPFEVCCRYLSHSVPCMGYRLTLEGKTIAYCPDTGYCANAVALATGADLLIAECALKPGEESPEWPHLNPETAIRIAREAGSKRLALVHFDARSYPTAADRDRIGSLFGREFPSLIITHDDLTIPM